MLKVLILIGIFLSLVQAKDGINISQVKLLDRDEGLNAISKEYEISKYLLMAFASVESSLNPYAIGISEKNKSKMKSVVRYLKMLRINYKQKSSNLSIYPSNYQDAKKALIVIKHFDLRNYGVGYTQISRVNIKKLKVDAHRLFENSKYSFKYSAKIITDCWKTNKRKLHAGLECYYKGTNSEKYNYSYSSKVVKHYNKIKKILGVI